jgi:hypothetical protein
MRLRPTWARGIAASSAWHESIPIPVQLHVGETAAIAGGRTTRHRLLRTACPASAAVSDTGVALRSVSGRFTLQDGSVM